MPDSTGKPTYDELERRVADQDRRIADLEQQVGKLTKALEEALRAQKRQSAPFSKNKPKADPKPPGRKPGDDYGRWACRARPEHIDETLNVPLPRRCPDCSGVVEEVSVDEQFQTDLPPIKPITRRFVIHVGCCAACGRTVRPRHALQTSDATGAAAVQIGPNALALGALLNKGYGLAWAKVMTFFARTFGIKASRSAFCRAALRLGARVEPTYDALVEAAKVSPTIQADETGWRIGGATSWLWVFVAKTFTVYRISRSRGHDVLDAVLGPDYAGIIGRDGWAPYRHLLAALHQSCLAHHLARAHETIDVALRGAGRFPHAVIRILKAALDLRDRRADISAHGFAVARGRIEARMDALLRWEPTWAPNSRFVRHLRNERPHLFTFLYHPEIEASNWPAEQAIRPAVITRKLSGGGNRTDRGAHVQEVLVSVIRTCAQQGRDALGLFVSAFYAVAPVRIQLAPAANA